MAEEEKKTPEGQEGAPDNTPTPGSDTDAFGQSTTPEEAAPKGEGEGEGEQGKEKKHEPIPEDHPTIVALTKQIEDVKREYGGNLKGQKGVIERLEQEIKDLKEGKAPEGAGAGEGGEDVLYKDIKWSKDLTQDERDAMTETEIKQMDEIAEMKTAQNKMYADQQAKGKQEEKKEVEDRQSLVKNTAMEIAKEHSDGKENVELANQIIESVKQFQLDGLDEATIKERVKTAHTLLPDYKAPQEQPQKKGTVVKDSGKEDDPFGVDKIVEEATKPSDGNYSL